MIAIRVQGILRDFALALLLAATAWMSAPPRMASAGGGGIIYVKWNASGGNNGSSWANAYTSLQTALDAAALGAYEIWVAAGTYRPFRSFPVTDPTDTFQLHNNVALYGGFAGTETLRSQRNWQTNVTILNGYWFILGNPHFAYHVVTGSGTNATAVLDGFTITGGKAQGDLWDGYGGGMLNIGGSPTVSNVTFSGNSAWVDGGGMVNALTSNPTLTNVTFSGNSAASGGGMISGQSNPTLTNVTFSGNSASLTGGAMYNNASNPNIVNSILWGNTAPSGPQIMNVSGSSPAVTYSDIQGGYAGTGNINSDPKFMRNPNPGMSDYGDLRLQPGSPAIDAGSNAAVPSGVTTDRDGSPRIMGKAVDMGAYEAFLKVFLPLSMK